MNEDRRFLWALFGAGAAARLAFLLSWFFWGLGSRFPYDAYPSIALARLGLGPGLPDITLPPLYPAVLTVLFWIFGSARHWATPAAQCLLSAASPLLLYAWALPRSSKTTARLAAAWMAFDPALIFFAPQYQSETLFVFLVLCFFVSLDARSFGAGVLGAAASLCRGVFLPYAPLLGIFLLFKRRWKPLTALVLGWSIPILLWTARNYRRHHAFIPVSVQSGWNMWEGFTLDREEIKRRPAAMDEEARARGISDPIAKDRYFQAKTRAWVREHPAETLKIVVLKAFRFWRPWPYDPYPAWIRLGIGLYFALLLGLAAVGVAAVRNNALELMPVFLFFVSSTVVHSIFFTSLRYRLPLEPFLCFFAAVAVDWLIHRSAPGRIGG